jgi:hypothetical protein
LKLLKVRLSKAKLSEVSKRSRNQTRKVSLKYHWLQRLTKDQHRRSRRNRVATWLKSTRIQWPLSNPQKILSQP